MVCRWSPICLIPYANRSTVDTVPSLPICMMVMMVHGRDFISLIIFDYERFPLERRLVVVIKEGSVWNIRGVRSWRYIAFVVRRWYPWERLTLITWRINIQGRKVRVYSRRESGYCKGRTSDLTFITWGRGWWS